MRITFLPICCTVTTEAESGTVGQLAACLGLGPDQPCGGEGTCGKCRILAENANSFPTGAELQFLTPKELSDGFRLACQCPLEDGLVVSLGRAPEMKDRKIPKSDPGKRYARKPEPVVRKKIISLTGTRDNDPGTSLAEVLCTQTGTEDLRIPLELLKSLPGIFAKRKSAAAVFTNSRFIALEDEKTHGVFGVAIDIGTTSLVVWLVDLESATVLDTASELNPQTSFGADVLSRISVIQSRERGLEMLKDALLSSLNRMIATLARKNGLDTGSIYAAAVSGNTIMEHIFLGVDPSPIGRSPFIPVTRCTPSLKAESSGLDINPRGEIVMIPNISGFVGGDITAGVEASGMFRSSAITLFTDIGTNSEIVLGNRDFLLACSAAAGPAFEGARISHGMRAVNGAVERVAFQDGNVLLGVIGEKTPEGICGSGIVDLVAEMLRSGLIDKNGKFSDTSPDSRLHSRISNNPQGLKEFCLYEAGENKPGGIVFTQKDVREVQLAKGAIATGIQILLEKKDLKPGDLDRVVVAGAFGNYINMKNAVDMGILPKVSSEKIEYIGNSSVIGAFHALVSLKDYRLMKKIARKAEFVELSSRSDFQQRFLSNMSF